MKMDSPTWVKGTVGAVSVLTFLYDVITFPVYLAIQSPWKRRQLSNRIKVSVFYVILSGTCAIH